ncbi:MAG: GNAT family N-acetyltransferase [Saprospiraceae bacterium]|nr:GNAT family N-acetyltransferase [Saprospiraceae bacterium]
MNVFNQILPATIEDAIPITALFKSATDYMIRQNIRQWNYTYPLLSHVSQDIDDGNIFVLKSDGQIKATISLDAKQDNQYQNIRWKIKANKVLVIHRLAVHPDFMGMGLGKQMCQFAEKFGIKNGYEVIRLDAFSRNPQSLALYSNLGYGVAGGYCYFHKNPTPFYCFEKKLKF